VNVSSGLSHIRVVSTGAASAARGLILVLFKCGDGLRSIRSKSTTTGHPVSGVDGHHVNLKTSAALRGALFS
jgi:hypothetical protein